MSGRNFAADVIYIQYSNRDGNNLQKILPRSAFVPSEMKIKRGNVRGVTSLGAAAPKSLVAIFAPSFRRIDNINIVADSGHNLWAL